MYIFLDVATLNVCKVIVMSYYININIFHSDSGKNNNN